MAVSQVMDYIENGNIINSVNMPRVSLGKKTCPRLSVICKANAAADVLAKVAELELTNVASGTRGDYSYILADLGDKKAELKLAGVIRSRIIE